MRVACGALVGLEMCGVVVASVSAFVLVFVFIGSYLVLVVGIAWVGEGTGLVCVVGLA